MATLNPNPLPGMPVSIPYNVVHIDQLNPYYPYTGAPESNYQEYHWVKVADMDKLVAFRQATLKARAQYDYYPYLLSSNRFVSAVLKQASITVTSAMHAKIGRAPGIHWCEF